MPESTTSQLLARRILAIRSNELPPTVVSNARTAMLDTIGVTLAGSLEPAPRLLSLIPGMAEAGPSVVLGRPMRVSALNAALLNGTASHALDYDDVNIALGGHPSAPVLSALMALTGEVDCTGEAFIKAFVAGFETETRIARGVNFHHYEKGWHPTATLGIFGATAACATLLELSEEKTSIAIAIAASMAAGLKANFGTMTKPLHVGQSARNGLMAALLARQGFTANPLALEHHHGFFEVFNGRDRYNVEAMLADWGTPYDIDQPGLGIKLYPCCGSSHAAIDCMLDLLSRHRIDPATVISVEVRIHARRLSHIDNPYPSSGLEGKFSVQYCLARALQEGRVIAPHFSDAAVKEDETRSTMQKVRVESYVNPPPDHGDHYRVELALRLANGDSLHWQRDKPTGRSPQDPTPIERVISKFDSCSEPVLGSAGALAVRERIDNLETLRSVRELTDRIHRS